MMRLVVVSFSFTFFLFWFIFYFFLTPFFFSLGLVVGSRNYLPRYH